MEAAIARVPALETAGVKQLLNGPESFTPDGNFILGEAPELRNFYHRGGVQRLWHRIWRRRGHGLGGMGGQGEPRPMICGRWIFAVLAARIAAWIGCANADGGGLWQALYHCLAVRGDALGPAQAAVCPLCASGGGGGVFWRKAGVGAAQLVCQSGGGLRWPLDRYSYGRPGWFGAGAREHRAAREAAVLIDQSSFAKFTAEGAGCGRGC